MLEAHRVRDLLLETPGAPGRPAHLGAASGLVRRADWLYVIGDDENDLGVFRYQSREPGRMLPIFDSDLPLDHAERKAIKPDLEALTTLPPFGTHEYGALLGLGSGSTTARERGFAWGLKADGSLDGNPHPVDLSSLYEFLKKHVAELNIEGVAVTGDHLALFQRGNSETGKNLIIRLALPEVFGHLETDYAIRCEQLEDVTAYELGHTGDNEVELTFTDADALTDGALVFTAAAEDTSDPYSDGEIAGSAVGLIDAKGVVTVIESLNDPSWKVEGVDAVVADELVHLLMVCDADDPEIPSPLLSATLPLHAAA